MIYHIRLMAPPLDGSASPWHETEAEDDMGAITAVVPGLLAQHRRLDTSVLVAVNGGNRPGPRLHRVHLTPGPKTLPDVIGPRDIFAIIQDRRDLYGTGLADLSKATGISTSRLSDITRSRRCTWEQMEMLARAVGFRMGFISARSQNESSMPP